MKFWAQQLWAQILWAQKLWAQILYVEHFSPPHVLQCLAMPYNN